MSEEEPLPVWLQVHAFLVQAGALQAAPETEGVSLVEFFEQLKDGAALCRLLNIVAPRSVTLYHTSPKLQMHCQDNIRSFIKAASTRPFNLKKGDLCTVDDLFYAANFGTVMHCLCKLSATPIIAATGISPVAEPKGKRGKPERIYEMLQQIREEQSEYSAWSDRLTHVEDDDTFGEELILADVSPTPTRHAHTHLTEKYGEPTSDLGHILLELVNTEISYINQLSLILNDFRMGVCNIDPPLSSTDVQIIFCNLPELYALHSSWPDLLRQIIYEPQELAASTTIGRIITQNKETLKQYYARYCTNIPEARERLEILYGSHDTFRAAHDRAMETADVRQRLTDLVSIPAQRILRYPLLLKEVLKKTSNENTRDIEDLKTALNDLKEIATFINESKRQAENRKLVEAIEERIDNYYGDSLSSYGRLLKDGDLDMRLESEGRIKSRYVFLFESAMVITVQKEERFDFKFEIDLEVGESRIEPVSGGGKQLVRAWSMKGHKHETVSFYARSHDAMIGWMRVMYHVLGMESGDSALGTASSPSAPDTLDELKHDFRLAVFSSPTTCYQCNTLIWGFLSQGLECRKCNINVHRKCVGLVNVTSCLLLAIRRRRIAQGLLNQAARRKSLMTNLEIIQSVARELNRDTIASAGVPPSLETCSDASSPPPPVPRRSADMSLRSSAMPMHSSRRPSAPAVITQHHH